MLDKVLHKLRTVPFLSYVRADTGDTYADREQREYETRTRHWAMVWYTDHKTEARHTAEFMVITEGMPDFCGGMLVYSPRVDTFDESCSWTNHFCAPGAMPEDERPSTLWKDFKQSYAIDLERYTGFDGWNDALVRQYGLKCIMAQVCGEAMNHGKRGFIGADFIGGSMTRLWDMGLAMGEFPVNRIQQHVHIKNKMSSGLMRCYDGSTSVVCFDGRKDDEWYNTNSGNDVHWLTATMCGVDGNGSAEGSCWNCGHTYNMSRYEECPECEEYNEFDPHDCVGWGSGEHAIPKYVKDVVENPEYQRRARRYFWRNG